MIYKRRGEELTKQCDNCSLVWRDSWLERYQDENECPFCGYEFVMPTDPMAIINLEPIKTKATTREERFIITVASLEHKIYLNRLILAEKDESAKESEENWTNGQF